MIHHGDCLDVLKTMPDNSVDAIVTDPPYGISFMGKKWDYDVPSVEIWQQCLRVLKPGGHLLAFAGTRTQHRMAVRIEDAGFEIRDMIAWVYGSGFPKSLNLSKSIDKNSATESAKQWDGWGSAIKPAMEPITLARKPLDGTIAQNVLKWGVGGINVDGCRVDYVDDLDKQSSVPRGKIVARRSYHAGLPTENSDKIELNRDEYVDKMTGRFPANLIHDGSDEVLGLFPETKGELHDKKSSGKSMFLPDNQGSVRGYSLKDSGSAARFFYCAKASKSERGEFNNHPTVKPIKLMRYLCRLVTPPNGIVLDPFAGSGTTLIAAIEEGFNPIGIERDQSSIEIINKRLSGIQKKLL
jgi:DNA modification methylase